MVPPLIARRVQLVGFDVDGVMTDGGVYVGTTEESPVELKRFDIRDNLGIRFLRAAGLTVVVVSGRVSAATRIRGEELEVDAVAQESHGVKLPAFQALGRRCGVRLRDCAFMGDDLPDLPILRRVGLGVAPANACPEVRAAADHVTEAVGGRGAVREFAEEFLRARGSWDEIVQRYLVERGETVGRADDA